MRRITTIIIVLLAFCLCFVLSDPLKTETAAAQKDKVTKENILKKAPGILIIEQLSDQYAPVRFNHKSHTQPMAVMGMECSACHHYSPPEYFPPCRKCHNQTRGKISSTSPLNKPSLEGAYHRQCINCHREWSHDIECSSCHAKKDASKPAKPGDAVTEPADWEHPVMEPDDRTVYRTKYNGNTTVTFLHKEHLELFEIKCVDCHREGNCSLCHDTAEQKEAVKGQSERHKSCVSCHALEGNCQRCHTKTAKQGFDHGQRSGWPLKGYHLKLNCRRCHITKGKFGNLETGCNACHSAWNTKNFNHIVTGVALDEEHQEIDCEYCHIDGKFDEEPSCSECHDDVTYPQNRPGPSSNEKEKK